MKPHIDQYIEASGAPAEIKGEFDELVRGLPDLSKDPKTAAIQVKEFLQNTGFSYDLESFTAQDVLGGRKGNCLGFPLLMGALLGEHGFRPGYQIIVTPRDMTYKEESEFFENLNQEMPYDRPELAVKNDEIPRFRFAPLEHLVLNFGGLLIETASPEHRVPEGEAARPASFQDALSFVYKDRALNAATSTEEVRRLLERGMQLSENNRQLYAILALNAMRTFDDKTYNKAVERFNALGGDDSLYHYAQYDFTDDEKHLDRALEKLPSYAPALADKARLIDDQRESRFLFALASQGHALSGELDLSNFYILHAEKLGELFGKEKIREIMQGFSAYRFGDFVYHLAIGILSQGAEAETHLDEAAEAIETPYQELSFAARADKTALASLDRKYGSSTVYQDLRKSLKT